MTLFYPQKSLQQKGGERSKNDKFLALMNTLNGYGTRGGLKMTILTLND